MANVSKNIRRLRTDGGLTQAQLADKLNVTRQTVSSWETGRTQPDLDTLLRLSDALDAEIETLIYGKKRRTVPADPAAARRHTLTVILSVLGALLLAAGAILIFVYFWQELGQFFKTALAFLPLLFGAGAGLFGIFGKKENVYRREICAVLWIAGMISTNALINGIFQLHFGFEALLAADLLLSLPVIFLLQSSAAYTGCLGMLTVLAFSDFADPDRLPVRLAYALLCMAALGVCILFACRNRLPEGMKKVVSAAALPVGACVTVVVALRLAKGEAAELFLLILTAAYCYWLADRTKRTGLPLRAFGGGAFGIALFIMMAAGFLDGEMPLVPELMTPEFLGTLLFCALCAAFAGVYGRESLRGDKLKAVGAGLLPALAALNFLLWSAGGIFALIPSFAFGVFALVSGVRRAKLSAANFGIVNVLALLFLVLTRIEDLNMLSIGIFLFAAGVLLLALNKVLIKRFAVRKEAAAATDTPETEGGEDDA